MGPRPMLNIKRFVFFIGIKLNLFLIISAFAQGEFESKDKSQDEFIEIGFKQKLNEQLPLDLVFRDDEGNKVELGKYFNQGKPVILNMVYYECPMLCNLQLNGLTDSLKKVPFNPGEDYSLIAVSFDHEETHVLAKDKKANYIKQYGRYEAEDAWHFLVGELKDIQVLADAVGFAFKYDPETDEYSHKSGVLCITPEGKISRYFPGVEYEPRDLKFGMMEASKGKIGSLADKIFLSCFSYDPETGKYNVLIHNTLKITSLLTVVAMGILLTVLFKSDLKKMKSYEDNNEK